MNCTICGQKIVLVPSAEERSRKDTAGRPASWYTGLFTEHADCTLRRRKEDMREALLKRRAASVSQG